uniref:Uncharacterized protein n=1 Tax=Romanomermis culicivorax TaxID=13658 RepID=A0A915I8E1_ROMCU
MQRSPKVWGIGRGSLKEKKSIFPPKESENDSKNITNFEFTSGHVIDVNDYGRGQISHIKREQVFLAIRQLTFVAMFCTGSKSVVDARSNDHSLIHLSSPTLKKRSAF